MASQRVVPAWPSNVVFGHFRAPGLPLGPPWLPDLAQGHSGPLQTVIYNDFSSILDGFGEDFEWIFLTMPYRIVTHVLAILKDFLGPLSQVAFKSQIRSDIPYDKYLP